MKKLLNASRDSHPPTHPPIHTHTHAHAHAHAHTHTHTHTQYTIVDIITLSKCDLTIAYLYIE